MKAILAALIVQLCALRVHCITWVKEMENKGAFQGDMILDPDEFEHGWNVSRGYASIKGGRWPYAVVPYVITNSIGSSGIRAIKAAIANYHQYTCIRWKPRTNEGTYVSFYRGGGCSSPVGYRNGRVNHISLATGCWYTGVTMHEMGHTLGFYHEQSRPDRDKYVRIIWGNIQRGMAFNFNKQNTRNIDSLGTPYDFRSMMHYGSTAFGNGRMTIQTIDPDNQGLIGNRQGFSSTDAKQLNLMYQCGSTEPITKPDECVNLKEKCVEWSERGYCKGEHEEYMDNNCCLACRNLGKAVTTETPTVVPVTIKTTGTEIPYPPKCNNKYGYCNAWAEKGWCRGNFMKYMILNCCKACSDVIKPTTPQPPTKAPTAASKCVDEDTNCRWWARTGECDKNPDWMSVHCKISCDTC